jgi:hypothetical protein
MIFLFHWTIAYCKATKRIGRLNFTNVNLPFVVINLLMVCLSIAGRTTQGYTGCQKHVCLLLVLILVTSKRSGMLGQRENVALGTSMILCSTTDLVPTSCACHLVLVCSSLGAGSMFASSMHSHRQKQTNLYSSKPESAREAPVKVKHPFQRTCVLLAIRRSARISDNTM